MSADNFVGVRKNDDDTYSIFEYGSMSNLDKDCQYMKDAESNITASTRAEALVKAHDIVNNMDICEYGVVEISPAKEPCGSCFVCVHDRGIISPMLKRCDYCHEVFTDSDWRVSNSTGMYHNSCFTKVDPLRHPFVKNP